MGPSRLKACAIGANDADSSSGDGGFSHPSIQASSSSDGGHAVAIKPIRNSMQATRKSARGQSIATTGFVAIALVISAGRMRSTSPSARRAGSHCSSRRLNMCFCDHEVRFKKIKPKIGSYVTGCSWSRGSIAMPRHRPVASCFSSRTGISLSHADQSCFIFLMSLPSTAPFRRAARTETSESAQARRSSLCGYHGIAAPDRSRASLKTI